MKASCPVCTSRYPIPNEKLQGKTNGLPVRCRHCGAVFRVYDDGRSPSLQNPPDKLPWAESWEKQQAEPSHRETPIKAPIIGRMEPAARESGIKKRVVRSTIINQPPPDLGPTPMISLDQMIRERRAEIPEADLEEAAELTQKPAEKRPQEPPTAAPAADAAPLPEKPLPIANEGGVPEDELWVEAIREHRRSLASESAKLVPPPQIEPVAVQAAAPTISKPEPVLPETVEAQAVAPAAPHLEPVGEKEVAVTEVVTEAKPETPAAEPAAATEASPKTPTRKRKPRKKAKPVEAVEEIGVAPVVEQPTAVAEIPATPPQEPPTIVEEAAPETAARKGKPRKKVEKPQSPTQPQAELAFPFVREEVDLTAEAVTGESTSITSVEEPPITFETPAAEVPPMEVSTLSKDLELRTPVEHRVLVRDQEPALSPEEALAAASLKAEPWKSDEELAAIALGEEPESSYGAPLPIHEPAPEAVETKPTRRVVHMGIADDFHDPELEEMQRQRAAAKAAEAGLPKRSSFWDRFRKKSTHQRRIILPEAAGFEARQEPAVPPLEPETGIPEEEDIPDLEAVETTAEPLPPEPPAPPPAPEVKVEAAPNPPTVPESKATTPTPLDWEPDLPPEAYDDLTFEAMGVRRPEALTPKAKTSEQPVSLQPSIEIRPPEVETPKPIPLEQPATSQLEEVEEEHFSEPTGLTEEEFTRPLLRRRSKDAKPARLKKRPAPVLAQTPLAGPEPESPEEEPLPPEPSTENAEAQEPSIAEEIRIQTESTQPEIAVPRIQRRQTDRLDEDFRKIRGLGNTKKKAIIAGTIVLGIILILVLIKAVGKFKSPETEQPIPAAATTPAGEPKPKSTDPERYSQAMEAAKPGAADNYHLAVKLLNDVLAVDPEYTPAICAKAYFLALLAINHQEKEGAPMACELAERSINQAPKSPDALRAKAACLLASNRLPEAEKNVQQAIAAQTDDELADAESYFLLSLVYQHDQDEEKAMAMANTAIEQNPLHIAAYHQKAMLHAKRKEWSEAKQAEQKALVQLDESLAENKQAVTRFKENIDEYQKMIEKHQAKTTLTADATAGGNTYDEKKKLSDQLLAKLWETQNPRESLTITDELLVLGIYTGRANLKKCELLNSLGRYREAVPVCTSATSFSSKAYWHLGGAYEQLNNQDMKKQSWETYLKMAPNGPYAAEIRRLLGG